MGCRRVEVRCIDTSVNTSDLGTKYLDKQKTAALLSMMPWTQFGGEGRAVGAVLESRHTAPTTSDKVKSECEIGGDGDEDGCAVGVGGGPARVERSSGTCSRAAVEREEFARS